MDTLQSLNHTVWECKHHVVFTSSSSRNAAARCCMVTENLIARGLRPVGELRP